MGPGEEREKGTRGLELWVSGRMDWAPVLLGPGKGGSWGPGPLVLGQRGRDPGFPRETLLNEEAGFWEPGLLGPRKEELEVRNPVSRETKRFES